MNKVSIIIPLYANIPYKGGVMDEAITRAESYKKSGGEYEFFNPSLFRPNIDVFHIYMANHNTYDVVLKLKDLSKKIVISPIIDTQLNIFFLRLFSKIDLGFFFHNHFNKMKKICEMGDVIIARSRQEYDMIRFGLSIPENKIVLSKNIVNYNNKPTNELNTKKNKEILFVGDWGSKRKNVVLLCEAIIELNLKLKIIGKGSESKYKKQILELSKRFNKNIQIVGYVKKEELIKLYKCSEVLAMPSLFEGTGLAALESLMYGCKLVITKKGGVKDYFFNNTFFVNPKSKKDLKNKITMALQSNFKASELKTQNNDQIEQMRKIYNF
jgi:glycosyltransferase involved in cell wall biosynthesis